MNIQTQMIVERLDRMEARLIEIQKALRKMTQESDEPYDPLHDPVGPLEEERN